MQIHVEAKLFIFLIAQLTSSLHGYSEILVFPLVPTEALHNFPYTAALQVLFLHIAVVLCPLG